MRAVLTGSVLCFVSTIALIVILAVAQDPEAEPGMGATVAAWTLGTVLRAGAGYVAGRMSVRMGSVPGVAGAALGGVVAAGLHRRRIRDEARSAAFAY